MPGLIFDASTQTFLLAIAEGKDILISRAVEGGKNLSATLFPILQTALDETKLQIKNLDYVAVGIGPGSYMGIRSTAMIARTFSFVHNIPLISFLSPLAFIPKIEGRFAFIDDAKMNQIFLIKGTYINDTISHLSSPFLIEKNEYLAHLQQTDILVTSLSLQDSPLSIIPPQHNFSLLTNFCFQNFLIKNFRDLQLIYLR